MENKINIIIADDHPLFSQGLIFVLSKKENFKIIGQAADGKSALELIKTYEPDIAILDVQMPKMDGFEIAKTIVIENIPTKIIFLTMFSEETFVKKVIELGVKGYLLKENAVNDIVSCVEAVANGKIYLSPEVSSILLGKGTKNKFDCLTKTEKKIYILIGNEKSSKEIGEELFISTKTVENHRSNICKKLGITGSSVLLKYALQNKIPE